jgi:hypothetical protein
MKAQTVLTSLPYIMAFVTGVILFASFWRGWFGFASSEVVLVGMAGVAIAVTAFWLGQKLKSTNKEEE